MKLDNLNFFRVGRKQGKYNTEFLEGQMGRFKGKSIFCLLTLRLGYVIMFFVLIF